MCVHLEIFAEENHQVYWYSDLCLNDISFYYVLRSNFSVKTVIICLQNVMKKQLIARYV